MSFTIFELAEGLEKAAINIGLPSNLNFMNGDSSKQIYWNKDASLNEVLTRIKGFSSNIHFGQLLLPDYVELAELVKHKNVIFRYISFKDIGSDSFKERWDILIFKSGS